MNTLTGNDHLAIRWVPEMLLWSYSVTDIQQLHSFGWDTCTACAVAAPTFFTFDTNRANETFHR